MRATETPRRDIEYHLASRSEQNVVKPRFISSGVRRRIQTSWGMTPSEYFDHVAKYGDAGKSSSPMSYFEGFRLRAERKFNVPFTLTFKEWLELWEAYGLDHLGDSRVKLVRIDDAGSFEKNNLRIQKLPGR